MSNNLRFSRDALRVLVNIASPNNPEHRHALYELNAYGAVITALKRGLRERERERGTSKGEGETDREERVESKKKKNLALVPSEVVSFSLACLINFLSDPEFLTRVPATLSGDVPPPSRESASRGGDRDTAGPALGDALPGLVLHCLEIEGDAGIQSYSMRCLCNLCAYESALQPLLEVGAIKRLIAVTLRGVPDSPEETVRDDKVYLVRDVESMVFALATLNSLLGAAPPLTFVGP
ncbi:hypothetical protein KIPB_011110, partial [Kipferlia bialata]|eukprot:g11110.t1